MQVNKKRKKKVLEYIRASNDYSFEKFINEHKLGRNALYRASDVVIECPFHEDLAPSCSMNDSIGAFQCFSCGRHGSYIDFLVMYANEIEGIHTNFYQMLNSLLRDDRIMQSSLGFSTIYENGSVKLLGKREKVQLRDGVSHIGTFVELADEIKKRKLTEKEIRLFISLMQQDFTVEEVSRIMLGGDR